MDFLLKTGDITTQRTNCLVVGVYAKNKMPGAAQAIDKKGRGALGRILKKGDFKGKTGDTQLLYNVPGCNSERILLVGLGVEKEYDINSVRCAAAAAAKALEASHVIEAISTLTEVPCEESVARIVQETIVASENVLYQFSQCKSDQSENRRPIKKIGLFIGKQRKNRQIEQAITWGKAVAKGAALAKDLGNLPGNICTPTYLADQAKSVGRKLPKLKVQILEEKRMKALGMGSLLSVSRGSTEPAKLIVMEYKGGSTKSKPVVLVGKGLTFDAGGISLKPSAAMDEMKYDMCGGASVIGTVAACAEAELPINVIGLIPASENLPDGSANKPGDIVTSMSGQTIEILNTDAEGRLILCDTLTYAKRYNPDVVIDVATLTGACIVALGDKASGLLSNNDTLANDLLNAGDRTGDRAWRLPLWDEYQSQLESNFADMANIGGKGAGTITAACFLARFTKEYKWAHLDIAGTAWKSGAAKGSTGKPVPLLTQYLLKRCKLDN